MSAVYVETLVSEVTFFEDSFYDQQAIDIEVGDQLSGTVGIEYLAGPEGTDVLDTASINVIAGNTYTFTVAGDAQSNPVSLNFNVDGISASAPNAIGTFELTVTYTASTSGPVVLAFGTDGSATAGVNYTVTLAEVIIPGPTEGDDNLIGNMTSDRIDLLGGNDTYVALGGSDVVTGGLGDDNIDGVCGNDRITGNEGNDTLLGGNGRDIMSGGADNDLMDGGNQEDVLNGDGGNDTLIGEKGDDTIDGGDNDDFITGGKDDDLMTGGAGADTFVFSNGDGQDIITDFTQGEDKIDLTLLNVWDISQLGIQGSADGVRISTGDGNYIELVDLAEGMLTNDDFILDAAPVIEVTEGGDTFTGTEASETYLTAGGSDRVYGLGGDDTIDGGTGQDTIDGGEGNDLLIGGSGKDQIKGGEGNDVVLGGSDNDKLEGGNGHDDINGGNANDRIYGDSGNDTLVGENGNDKIWGGDDDDKLLGGAGKDVLNGGNGADKLIGGWGDDELTGGQGADIFIFTDDRTRADTITDFEIGIDMIQISSYGITDISELAFSQLGDDAVITLSARDSITIENTLIGELTNADFELIF
ncbi:hypothetical protein C1J03_10980 [Sulfitobacter sp. SK012]|uniref:calcium-binding protein n=1 Tax=Sulfitobacter sp. SK012 TaxID=1389005 RepID=UPI000E0AB55D|nr:calcium-binding protein [Sulfitobacter sp. SK012]AXI46498.1 hypothetical protein C1J03_10980 [Sulfitobacter sp. SK012]